MAIQTHKVIHLAMDFFSPSHGDLSHKQGFLAEIPRATTESGCEPDELPVTVRCIFSESTSHSIATESILSKLAGRFLWLDGVTKEPDPLYNLNATQPYFFTSALGEACQEDRQKENPVTPQLEVVGTIDFYFKVNNDDEKPVGSLKIKHHFRLPQVIVVKELFPCQPAITAESTERFEVCLGQDFFQTYPHLLFEFTNPPTYDMLISSIHLSHPPTLSVDKKGILSVYTAGIFVTTQDSEQEDTEVHGGFGVYFSPDSVYNTFHHLPSLRSSANELQFYNDKEAAARVGNYSPTVVPTKERADLAGFVLALEMVISLFRLGHSFLGVNIYHNSNYFMKSQNEARTGKMRVGAMRPNTDLIHRRLLLQAMIEDPKRCDLSKVEFHRVDGETLFPAKNLAELGAKMWAFKGSMTYAERCIATGSEHPLKVSSSLPPCLPAPKSSNTNNTKADSMPLRENNLEQAALEQPDSPMKSDSSSITLGRSRSGSLSRRGSLKGKVASRVPMFLNYGSTITYASQGNIVAFTPRELFLLSKEQATIGQVFEKSSDDIFKIEQETEDHMVEGAREGVNIGYPKNPYRFSSDQGQGPRKVEDRKGKGVADTIPLPFHNKSHEGISYAENKELGVDMVGNSISMEMRADMMKVLKRNFPKKDGSSRAMVVEFEDNHWKLDWEDSDEGDSIEAKNSEIGHSYETRLLDQETINPGEGDEI